jgi:hypothetical protein
MKLRWGNTEEGYQGIYNQAYMRFERSVNNAVSKTRNFEFVIYASENHTHRPAVGRFTLLFTNFSSVTTVFTDGTNQFKFNKQFNGFLDMDNNPYQPVAEPQVDILGYPGYDEVGHFMDELGSDIVFKQEFGESWLLAQEFEGLPLGQNWEIIK